MQVCLTCGRVYEGLNLKWNNTVFTPIHNCPKVSCYGKVVDIDELILPTIQNLNNKGFITRHCCSGHIYKNKPQIYISFEHSFEDFNCIFNNMPNGFAYEEHMENGYFCIRRILKSNDIYSEIITYNKILKDWSENINGLK